MEPGLVHENGVMGLYAHASVQCKAYTANAYRILSKNSASPILWHLALSQNKIIISNFFGKGNPSMLHLYLLHVLGTCQV